MPTLDPETTALMAIMQHLEPLEADARVRIIKYASERYGNIDFALPNSTSRISATTMLSSSISGGFSNISNRPIDASCDGNGRQFPAEVDITTLTNVIKNPEIYPIIEERIFHQRNQLNRILIALYAYEMAGYDGDGLTSGQIAKFFAQLRIRVHQPDISNGLSDQARQYVYPKGERKRGKGVNYRLSPMGKTHIENLLGAK